MLSNNFVDRPKTNLFCEFNQKFCNINKIFCKVNKTVQPKALVHLSNRKKNLVYPTKILF